MTDRITLPSRPIVRFSDDGEFPLARYPGRAQREADMPTDVAKQKITLRCPTCKRTQPDTKRLDYDPPKAVIRELECPTCLPEGWRVVTWFNAAGTRISK